MNFVHEGGSEGELQQRAIKDLSSGEVLRFSIEAIGLDTANGNAPVGSGFSPEIETDPTINQSPEFTEVLIEKIDPSDGGVIQELYHEFDLGGTGVYRILDQFFYNGSRALDHLTGSNLVSNIIR